MRKWVDETVPNGKNFVFIKLLIKESSIGEELYGNVYIHNNGVVEFIADLQDDGEVFDTLEEGNKILDRVFKLLEDGVINFMNMDYHKYVNSNMKRADTTNILNNIPREIHYAPDVSSKFKYYNSVLTSTSSKIKFQFDSSLYLSSQFFAPLINCLHPFVTIENDTVRLNQSVSFRLRTTDDFRLNGVIHDVLLNGRYDIVSDIGESVNVGDMVLKSGGKGVADAKVYWTVVNVTEDTINLSHVLKNGTVDATRTLTPTDLSEYKLYYPRVALYNINVEGDSSRLNVRWIRVNEFKRLTNLGREIAENIKNGLLREETEGSKRDNELRTKLRIKHGGVLESDLQELIVKIRNNVKTMERVIQVYLLI